MSPNQLKQTLRSFIVQILLVLFLKVRKAMTDSTKIYVQILTKAFKTHYKTACELTIADSMIGTKCILHYLLKKPTNGEVQVCADAATAYSTALYSIYIGKGDMCWQRLAAIQK